MATTTPKLALPYPQGGDAVGSVDDTVKALAERLELLLPFTFKTGVLPVAAVNTNYSQRINYPAGKAFPAGVVPNIQLTTNDPAPVIVLSADGVDNTGFTINYRRILGTANVNDVAVTVQRVTP